MNQTLIENNNVITSFLMSSSVTKDTIVSWLKQHYQNDNDLCDSFYELIKVNYGGRGIRNIPRDLAEDWRGTADDLQKADLIRNSFEFK